ncbi:MAG: amino acid ABC transporter substrate-binding protein [Gammaproteobacteria bacterium]
MNPSCHPVSLLLKTLVITTLCLVGSFAAAEDVIRIGAPLALTGALADEGAKQKLGYDLWLERVNAAGGIKVGDKTLKVELVTYDYQTDGKRAQQLAEKLITDDEVHFLTAPFGSGHTKITAAVAERYGVPIISVASSEPVHNQGFKNLFGTLAPSGGLIDAMIEYFKAQKAGLKSIAVLGRDDVFPRVMAQSMATKAAAAGIEVVYDELYPVGTVDHSAALSSIKAAKPDWLYITGYSQDLILARKQMSDLAVNSPIVTMITGPAYREFVDNLGSLAENVSSTTWWHHATAYESDDVFGSTKAFYDAVVKAADGTEPDYVHASSAAALIALQKAIEAAGSLDRDAVRKSLTELDIVTFFGPINFRSDGMNSSGSLPIIQVQDGKPVVIAPASLKTADVRLN